MACAGTYTTTTTTTTKLIGARAALSGHHLSQKTEFGLSEPSRDVFLCGLPQEYVELRVRGNLRAKDPEQMRHHVPKVPKLSTRQVYPKWLRSGCNDLHRPPPAVRPP